MRGWGGGDQYSAVLLFHSFIASFRGERGGGKPNFCQSTMDIGAFYNGF